VASLRDVVFDCRRPARLGRFWAGALDGYVVAPYDDAEMARLAVLGVDDPGGDPTVLVHRPGVVPRLWFQAVPEAKVVKNRVHLDLACDDASLEVTRLESLGARVLLDQPNDDLIVLADPEGNEFCLLRGRKE
jgi:hypothetical protein